MTCCKCARFWNTTEKGGGTLKHCRYLSLVFLFGLLLGVYKGKVALWKDDDPKPIRIFPYSAKLLPPADRRALEEGLRFESEEDLIRALTDYLS